MEVLWIDDDSPKTPITIDGVRVVSAQSIGEAERLLASGEVRPSWIVVDLIVPQSGWPKEKKVLYSIPGIEYIRYLDATKGDSVGVVAYGVALTGKKREEARKAGAKGVYEKMRESWIDVLNDLVQLSSAGGLKEV